MQAFQKYAYKPPGGPLRTLKGEGFSLVLQEYSKLHQTLPKRHQGAPAEMEHRPCISRGLLEVV